MTTQSNLVQFAKQGDARAIATLLNRSLQPKDITAKVNLKDGCLHVMLEANPIPDQQQLLSFLKKGLINLGCPAIQKVKVYGKKPGEDFPVWTEYFAFAEESSGESTIIQPSSSNPSHQTKESSLKTPSGFVQQKKQKTHYLNPLRNRFSQVEDNLWFCINQKALICIGICSKEQFLDSSKQGSTDELSSKFGKAILKVGSEPFIDFLKEGELSFSPSPKAILKLGIYGASWLGKIVADTFTSAEDFYKMAVDYLKSKNYQESIDSLNKAINKNKQYADALYLRGHIYSNLGDFQKAIKDLDKAISISSNYIDAYKERATVNYILGNYNQAIEDDNFLISNETDNPVAYFHRAMCFIALKTYEKALEDFCFLTKDYSGNISSNLMLYSYLIQGYIYLCHLKNLSEAVEKFNHAIKLQRNSIEAYLGCARVHEKLEEYDKAIQYYSKVIRDASGDSNKGLRASAYIGRCFSNLYYALSYAELGIHNSAIKHFSYANLDYRNLGVSKDRSKPVHIAILKGRCLSYLSLKKRFNARLDAFRAGIKSTEIKGLRLVIWEKACILALVFSVPIGVYYGIFTNPVNLLITPEVTSKNSQR